MKRTIFIGSAIVLASIMLAGCGNNSSKTSNNSTSSENSSLKAENFSLKARERDNFKDDDYALMAYLKLQGQSADDLNQNKDNMHWQRNGDTYSIDFGAHTTSMKVNKDNVEVTYDDIQNGSMGAGNGHKMYTKQRLAREFSNQKSTIEKILNTVNTNNSSEASSNTNNQGNYNSQNRSNGVSSAQTQADGGNVSSSSNGQKSITENGNTYTPKYNDNGQIDSWQVKDSDGITRTMGDPSPFWQQKTQEVQDQGN